MTEQERDSPPVDDNSPEIPCQPNLFQFCRYCGRDMDTSSGEAQR